MKCNKCRKKIIGNFLNPNPDIYTVEYLTDEALNKFNKPVCMECSKEVIEEEKLYEESIKEIEELLK